MARQSWMPTGDAVVVLEDFIAAVSADGVMYIAIDLSDVRDPTQFAFLMADSPVRFGVDDVVFYNRDGVDLTLFTLAVEDPTERQWGSYYGWDVEQDAGTVGTVYDPKVGSAEHPELQSDMLTYWRHEFHTYAAKHTTGGTHEVVGGMHPDGTMHIDHDHVIIAIRGNLGGNALTPGRLKANLLATSVVSENPVEVEQMAEQAFGSTVYVEDNSGIASFFAGLTGQSGSGSNGD